MVTRAEAEELLHNLFADPAAAGQRAEEELVPDVDPAVASIGHQVVGIVLRDLGEIDAALREMRTALRLARKSGEVQRIGDVEATLGGSLAVAGRLRDGMAHLDAAADSLDGVDRARVLVRRAWVATALLNRHGDAVDDLRSATSVFADVGDEVWLARALNLEGYALAHQGDIGRAAVVFDRATALHRSLGHPYDLASTVHNRGWLAFLQGDLPRALALYDDAAAAFAGLGVMEPWFVVDHSAGYLAAGMPLEALTVVDEAMATRPLQPRERADLLIAAAEAALAAEDLARATSAADQASRMLRTQGRDVRRLRADLVAIWARAEAGAPPRRLLGAVEVLIEAARRERAPELTQALLLGARVAGGVLSPRASELADTWLDLASRSRRASTATERALGWWALAQRREQAGRRGATLRACERGLAAVDEHRATLGSHELRALASRHGAQLAELGARTALASGRPRRLLHWAERWRATSLAQSSTTEERDPEIARELAALRAEHRRLERARADGEPTEQLQARVGNLEHVVRRRQLHARGNGSAADAFDVPRLLDALAEDDTILVELAEIDRRLHALVAGRGRVRRLDVGDAAAASAAVDFALFALRGAARGRRSQLDLAGARLQKALLGSALDHARDSRVVVSGTSALQGVPWGLLPGLASRPVTSTPSARLWLRARQSSAEADRRVMLVGPGLASGGAEVPAVAAQDPSADVLDGDDATVEASLAALDGAALAHVAAHGHFREDSPLFSSLVMADGPLLVHDLQRLTRPPHRVVLSACESGEMAPVGAQELLGLSAALLSMGTAGIVSSLGEVDDAATVEVMVALHAALRQGHGLGEAMLAAREVAAGDQVLAATAASFTALGV
jgi:tetratricopeptide (TPR) repeat protein